MVQPRTVLVDAGPWLPVPPRDYGGLENVVATLVNRLRATGTRVVLVAAEGSTLPCEELVVTGPPGFHLLSGPAGATGVAAVRAREHVEVVADVARARSEVDLVHTHTERWGPAVLAGRPDLPPVLHTLHWDPQRRADFYAALQPGPRFFVNGVSHAHVRRMPAALRRVAVGAVHLGTPAVPPGPPPPPGAPPLVLGRICPLKGQDIAARVCRDLDLPLVLAGPVGPYRDAGELAAARAAGSAVHPDVAFWSEHVEPLLDGERRRWAGSVGGTTKAALVAGAAALLMPVRWEEPGATVVVEALASGTPVVALARGALPELVDHGRTGFLTDDEAGLTEALTRLGDLDRAECRRAWSARFTPEHMAQGYRAAYATVLRCAGPGSVSRSSRPVTLGPRPATTPAPPVGPPR